jgi:integrase
MSLTERKIKYLEPGKGRQIVWDNGGFGVQVAPEGEKSFVLEYRFNEMTKLITLGIYPDMSLDMAREQAVKAMGMVIRGTDPEESGIPEPTGTKAVPVPASQTPTFDRIREKTSEKLDQFKEKAAAKLDEIKQRVEKKAGHPQVTPQQTADKIVQLNRKARIPEEKPKPPEKKAEVPKKTAKAPEKKAEVPKKTAKAPEKMAKAPEKKAGSKGMRDIFGRTLDKNELRTLWAGLENSDMPPANQLAIKLLIVTAQRYEEIVPARWADFDLVSKWWTVPESFTKNGKKHRIPLSNLASDLLRKIKELSGMSGILFPASGGVTPIDAKVLIEGLQRAQVRFGLKPFTLHNLQDSAVCQMLDNGIPEHTLYELLNEDEPTEFEKKGEKVTDSDLRKALDKLERQLPKSY